MNEGNAAAQADEQTKPSVFPSCLRIFVVNY